mmetsp:Transcript_49160/g.73056  ORF Transcript_49160/g.73056 Transcript_49160/m.73056 type:complete len:157 (+) Transcript_49160:155-625(+)|eukprot:CAMPEP_0195524232 /NCGR_PEP_ID=MMETSP0794_2-20130614/23948_1 /TAXON_ID=515487 /ORGANISM="Stephanopyxis turris, Strain CCMP 815" /LENGTH=156 /DNA_ID=CAMNT_0040654409 /DNA_START=126 /DNA_END=596 /DNA_ORIENTATION=+
MVKLHFTSALLVFFMMVLPSVLAMDVKIGHSPVRKQDVEKQKENVRKGNGREAKEMTSSELEEKKAVVEETNAQGNEQPKAVARKAQENAFGNPDPVNGPWPECLGWDGQDCMDYIQAEAPDIDNCNIIQPTKREHHRIYVVCDEFGVVVKVPHRG